jgi:hypothetical protein
LGSCVRSRPTDLENHSADRMVVTDDRGAFRLPGLVGDNYSVFAFDSSGQTISSSLFKRLMPLATVISVMPGESQLIDLKVTVVPAP